MILVDTSVWIDFFSGLSSPEHNELKRLIVDGENLGLAAITLFEILRGTNPGEQWVRLQKELLRFPLLEARGPKTYLKAAEIVVSCREKGIEIRKGPDAIIAAIALENDCEILHRDRDFDKMAEVCHLRIYRHKYETDPEAA